MLGMDMGTLEFSCLFCGVNDLTTLSQYRLTFSGSLLKTVFTSTWI